MRGFGRPSAIDGRFVSGSSQLSQDGCDEFACLCTSIARGQAASLLFQRSCDEPLVLRQPRDSPDAACHLGHDEAIFQIGQRSTGVKDRLRLRRLAQGPLKLGGEVTQDAVAGRVAEQVSRARPSDRHTCRPRHTDVHQQVWVPRAVSENDSRR